MYEITMPKLSDSMEVGKIIRWLVAEGDEVHAGDVLAEVESDKSTMELECFSDGVLTKIAHALGWFNTRLILTVMFYLLFTPIGLVLRLLGKDLLNRKIEPNAETYWIDREEEAFDRKRYEKQF